LAHAAIGEVDDEVLKPAAIEAVRRNPPQDRG
jgi:hypothetical protein